MTFNNSPYYKDLKEIVENVGIKEGLFGVITVLSAIDRNPGISSYNLSRLLSIPIPICVATRNEFVKKGWCEKKKGSLLTLRGKKVLNSLASINRDFYCIYCNGLGVSIPLQEYKKELEFLKRYSKLRGKPKTEIDQSFATPETSLMRVLFAVHRYDIFRQNFVFLGDSDLTSVALALFAKPQQKIVVFDIDERLDFIIEKANDELDTDIIFVRHDLRKPLPPNFLHRFDCVFTDPPYTLKGIKLFISRAVQTIDPNNKGVIYLSFVYKPPNEMIEIQKIFSKMGCLITDILPRFNTYIGAQKLGGTSTLFRLITTDQSKPIFTENYIEDELYTGDLNPIIRFYKCTKCGKIFRVGKNENYLNIEQLKDDGCPQCKNNKFQKIKEIKLQK